MARDTRLADRWDEGDAQRIEQADELGRADEADLGALRLQRGDKAREEDLVAQALFVPDDEAAAGEVLALPLGEGEGGAGRRIEAAFIERPTLGIAAQAEEHQTKVGAGRPMRRIEFDRTTVRRLSLFVASGASENCGEVLVRPGEPGRSAGDGPVELFGRAQVALGLKGHGPLVDRHEIGGLPVHVRSGLSAERAWSMSSKTLVAPRRARRNLQ